MPRIHGTPKKKGTIPAIEQTREAMDNPLVFAAMVGGAP
jgi:hypothetical protein